MAFSYSQLTALGVVVADAEVKTTTGGKEVLSFRLAINKSKKDASGKYVDAEPSYLPFKVFSPSKYITDLIKKGTKLFVTGEPTYKSYTNKKTNESKMFFEIIADPFSIIAHSNGTNVKTTVPNVNVDDAAIENNGAFDDDMPY